MITCPLCAADLDIEEDELDEGDVFNCDECGGSIKVASTGPLELEADEESKFTNSEDDDDSEDDEEEDDEDFDEDDEDEEEEEDEEDDWN